MANKGNKYKVGFLAITFIALLIIALVSLGILNYFKPKIEFMTATTQSVQGLEKGAKVKIRGVPVGQVTKILLGPDANIYIYMEFDPETFYHKSNLSKEDSSNLKNSFYDVVEKQIKNGLRCQLQYAGITGNMFVELDFYKSKKYPLSNNIELPKNHPLYIPSIPQTSIGGILDQTYNVLKDVRDIDFKGISDKIDKLLGNTNSIFNGGKVQSIIDEIKAIGENLNQITSSFNQVISPKKMNAMTDSLKRAVADFRSLTNITKDQLNESNIPELMNSTKTLVRNMNILVKYLENNPDALIKGKSGDKIVPSFSGENKKNDNK